MARLGSRGAAAEALAAVADPDAAALSGLDSLETAGVRKHPWSARNIWAATWPKLLAIGLVIGVWEIIHLSGWKQYVLPGPATVFANLGEQMQHAQLWQAIDITMRRAVIGFTLSVLIGAVIGALVSRVKPLRAAIGAQITAMQTMPSIAWFPFAIILFGATTNAIIFVIVLRAVGGQRADHRRRLHPTDAAAGREDHGPVPAGHVPAPDHARLAAVLRV